MPQTDEEISAEHPPSSAHPQQPAVEGTPDTEYGLSDKEILKQAERRYTQALESVKEDFKVCEDVQDFIAGDQWPQGIRSEREGFNRPCLTLDHLNQYVRHVVNSGLAQEVDIRVMAMSGEGDDATAQIIAGIIRQITQTSTAQIAYETGLRHECQNGFGFWRVKAMPTGCDHEVTGEPMFEIGIRRIADPRMVLMDPFCEYPDGRDCRYAFVMTKLSKKDYEDQYGDIEDGESVASWHLMDGKEVLPWIGSATDTIVVAEYYYVMPDGTMCWAILTPDKVLSKGVHHGDAMPVVRCVGDEFEQDGKQRRRGMIEPAMDSQRAYNYASSAVIENSALAPIAPFVAADGQIEQYGGEWSEAHRVPRAVLRYKPISIGGQAVPPPQRQAPANLSAGWQSVLQNLMGDIQSVMGLGQPSVSGTGVTGQTGAAIQAQQAPGDINTHHYHQHWHQAIEQTGRVILAMIPHVYTMPQVVKIVGDDGKLEKAMLAPGQEQAVADHMDAYGKVLGKQYNVCIGKYDVAISLGPSSATKKAEANKMIATMMNAAPQLIPVIGDLLFKNMDLAGADVIAQRLEGMQNMPTPEQMQMQQAKMQQQEQQIQEMTQMLLAEQQKSAATLQKAQMDNQAKLIAEQQKSAAHIQQIQLSSDATLQKAQLDADVKLEIAMRDNINALMIEKMKGGTTISTAIIKALADASKEDEREERMEGYGKVTQQLTQ